MAAEFTFDFCTNTRVAETLAPEESEVKDFNGWSYTPNPVLPYRRRFKIMLEGLRWYFNDDGTIDLITNSDQNAGRLELFYMTHRKHKPFNYQHEWLGTLELRFDAPVNVPKAMPNSQGLVEPVEVMAIHHNPSY